MLKKTGIIRKTALLMALTMLATTLFACKPSVDQRAAEYLAKYDDNFTFVEQKEFSGGYTFTFSSEKYPGKTVTVRYEGNFDTEGQNPFCDNYPTIMFEKECYETGKRVADAAFPGENLEYVVGTTGLYRHYDKNTTFDGFYSIEGLYFGIVLHKQVNDAVMDEDLAKIEAVLKTESDKIINDYAPLYAKILYYADDAEVLPDQSAASFENLKDYDGVLYVQYYKGKDACEVKEKTIK